jgi:CHAT domain-containing protein
MLTRVNLVRLCILLCGAAIALPAYSQQDDIDDLLSRGGASNVKELQTQAAAEPPKTNDKQELSIFYHERGMANYRLGNYGRAVDDLRLALENNQPNRPASLNWGDRYRIQSDLGKAIREGGDWFAAIEHWRLTALEYQQSNLYRYHNAQLKHAQAYSELGFFAEADQTLKKANDTLVSLRSDRRWASRQFDITYVNSAYNAAFARKRGDHTEAERFGKLAADYAEKELALKRRQYPEGHQLIRVVVSDVAGTKLGLADVLASRGKYGEAEFYARSGLEDRLAMFGFNTVPVSRALEVLGWTRFQQGDLEVAQKFYRHAVAALRKSGVVAHSTSLAARRAALANTLLVKSRWQDALKIFEERDRGLRSDPEQFNRIGSSHVSWALALLKIGQSQQAAEMTERMIGSQLKRTVPNKYFIAQLRGVLAMAQAALGNTGEALRAFQQAVPELIRRDQDDAASENSGYWRVFWQKVILEGYIELLGKLYVAGTAPGNLDVADEAFKMADVARGSGVQEAISATAARAQLPGNLADLARKDQDALNRIVALNQVLGKLAAAPEAERLNKVIADMRAEIERLRKEHASLSAEIRKRFPEYAELIDPRPPSIASVRKALAPGEALVAIYLSDAQAYVWTIGGEGKAAFRVVPVARAEVEADVARLRDAVKFGDGTLAQLPAFDLALAHKLYKLFLAPDEALWKEARVLNVIPHGALAQLPFSLLVTAPAAHQPGPGALAGYRDAAWLARKVAVAQLPSANAFAALRRAPAAKANRQSFIGFGDPIFSADAGAAPPRSAVRDIRKTVDATEARLSALAQGKRPQQPTAAAAMPTLSQAFALLSALPDTADELREIAVTLKADQNRDLYLNRQASEKNVKQAQLENRRVVAFATHGIAGGVLTGLDQPALVLSNPALTGDGDNDGFLTMEEVLGLKLDADWVVLSACNTAAADGRGSEAVSGLGRAFFFAGARSLLVSNWAVETTSARLVTTELFRRQSENPALTRAEALKQSMLSLMDKSAVDAAGRATFSYAHPAFWAPFSLVGDSGAGRAAAR